MLPDARARTAAMEALDSVSPATWARARAWAVLLGVILLDVGMVDDPGFVRMGERTLRAIDEGP